MLKVARPTTISDRTANRLLLAIGLTLLLGVPAIALLYWSDRNVASGPPIAEQAVAQAEAAVKANPKDLAARDHLAAAYVSAKRTQDGVQQFTEVLQIDAKDRPALLGRGIAYISLNQLDAAAGDFQKFIADNVGGEQAKSDPQLEQAYYELGVVQLQQGKASTAVTTLEKALAIDGGDADALYSLGSALVATGDDTKAVNALKLAAAFVPVGWCDPYTQLVKAYSGLKSADGIAWANGMVAFCAGRLDEAQAALQPLRNGAMKVDALMGLGYVAAAKADNASAASYFNQVLAVEPSNRSASIALSALATKSQAAPPAAPSPTPGATH